MDLRHELPLSWREPHDESAVTSDWRAALAQVLLVAGELVEGSPGEHASAELDTIRASEQVLESGKRVRIKQLDRAVYTYLALCEESQVVPKLDPTTSGAVALARAVSAPTPIRAVIAGHTLRATDAHWSFGHGPELVATAVELLNFLGGRSLQAPRPSARIYPGGQDSSAGSVS